MSPLQTDDTLQDLHVWRMITGDEESTGYGDGESVAFGLIGYPGAGKSTVGKILADATAGINIETGDTVRQGAVEEFGVDSAEALSGAQLGDYSTMRRDRDGGDYVAQDVIDQLEQDYDSFPNRPVVIAGMRDSEVPQLFDSYFDHFYVVWVHAPAHVRLERLNDRGRQDEGNMSPADLIGGEAYENEHGSPSRDVREERWGTGQLTLLYDRIVFNMGGLPELKHQIGTKLSPLGLYTASPMSGGVINAQ